MITVKIKANFGDIGRKLDDIAKRQIPFGVARGLTETARAVAQDIRNAMPAVFDRPTPFTRNAVAHQAARRDRLVSAVFVKDAQAKYLAIQETGGTRTPSNGRRALIVPGQSLPLNQYGNIPSGTLKRLAAQAERGRKRKGRTVVYLPQSPRGAGGYFLAFGNGRLRRLTGFTATERFSPRFGFRDRAAKAGAAIMAARIRQAVAQAVATAR